MSARNIAEIRSLTTDEARYICAVAGSRTKRFENSDWVTAPWPAHRYAGRIVDDALITEENPRYRFPTVREHKGIIYEFRNSEFLYAGYRLKEPLDDLIVVERFPSVWWLYQQGTANVVALTAGLWALASARDGPSVFRIDPEALPNETNHGVAGQYFRPMLPRVAILKRHSEPTNFWAAPKSCHTNADLLLMPEPGKLRVVFGVPDEAFFPRGQLLIGKITVESTGMKVPSISWLNSSDAGSLRRAIIIPARGLTRMWIVDQSPRPPEMTFSRFSKKAA